MRKTQNSFVFTKLLIDLGLIIILFLLFTFKTTFISFFEIEKLKSLSLLIFLWLFLGVSLNLYRSFRFERFIDYLKRIFICDFLFVSIAFLLISLFSSSEFTITSKWMFISLFLFFHFLFSFFFFYLIKLYRQKGYDTKNAIIIGEEEIVGELKELLTYRLDFGLKLSRVFNKSNNLAEIECFIKENKIKIAYVSLVNFTENEANELLHLLEKLYVQTSFVPSALLVANHGLGVTYLDSLPILTHKKYPLNHKFNEIVKRIFDIVFTLFVFVTLLWWLLPIITLAVYISQGAPIFFAQKRNGLNGKEFNCLKFRTMRPHKLNDLKPTERNDPRVTKLGRILRKTSLDELPQFFNVLKGEMSIVGPRPHMVSENETYSEIIKRYSLRHYVKPGITGLAQVRGYRGAVDSDKDMEKRIRTDIYYVRNWSFLLDLLIIYKTVKLMIVGDENAI